MNAEAFPDRAAETWLADRLWITGAEVNANLFQGITTPEVRRGSVRDRILELGWEKRRAGYAGDEPETFAELFERMYGQPLHEETPCEKQCEN